MRCLTIALVVAGSLGCTSEAARHRHFENGQRHLTEGRPSEAIIELRNAVDGAPPWGEARYLLAEAYEADGEPERAFREYLRAADLLPNNDRAQLKATEYLLLARQFTDARVRVERVLTKDPRNVEAWLLDAEALAGNGDTSGAVATLERVIDANPSVTKAHIALARVHHSQQRDADALAAYRRALTVDPQSLPTHLALANFYWSTGAEAETESTLKKALDINPAHIETHRMLAEVYTASRRSHEAERHLKRLTELSRQPRDRFALADFYIANRRLDDARQILEPLAGERRTSIAADTRLARLDDLEGNAAAADERLQRVLAQSANYSAALMLKAERSLRSGNWQEALWEANTAIAADPRLLPAYYIRAAIELQAQRLGDAMRSYSEILRLNPAAVDAKVALSRLHVARNEADSGVLYAEEALRNAPEDLDARLALIRAWLARGDDSLAHAEITRLMQDSRRSAELQTLAGTLHVRRGEVAAARRAFERALQIDPAAREALTALTTVDVNSRNVVRARRRVEAALTRSENDPQLLLLAAKVALIEKKFDHAETLLSRGLNADNLPTEGFVLMARLLHGERRLASAVARFDQLAASDPRNLSLRLMAAVAEHTAGNLATAEERYRAILALDPKSPLAANNLASIFVERGEHLDYAEQLATTALTQLPDAEVFDTLGSVQAKRLMFGQAAKSFERAVALRPDNAQFHYRLGLVYLALSDGARAKDTLDRAARLDPQLANASRDALASLQTP